jgi:hypothetical protein
VSTAEPEDRAAPTSAPAAVRSPAPAPESSGPTSRLGPTLVALVFGITAVPQGVLSEFTNTVAPYLLRRNGLAVEDIGWYILFTYLPSCIQFLYASVLDRFLDRRLWFALLAVLAGAALALGLLFPMPQQVMAFAALTLVGQWLIELITGCQGGLIPRCLPASRHSTAAGFMNAGRMGGGALASTLLLALLTWLPAKNLAPVVLCLVILPALPIFLLPGERAAASGRAPSPGGARPEAEQPPAWVPRGALWSTLRGGVTWPVLLLVLSPVSSGALVAYLPALALDYHATAATLALVSGALNAILTVSGSLAAGYLCTRRDAFFVYIGGGVVSAGISGLMAAAPLDPLIFALGAPAYYFIAGFVYAAFAAAVLRLISAAASAVPGASSAFLYTFFICLSNMAIAAVGSLDGRMHRRFGPRGVLLADTLLNLGGAVLSLAVLGRVQRQLRERTSRPSPPS